MPFIRCGEVDVYYEISGTGPRLLFIGGTGGDLRKKPNVFDSPLVRSFEVLAYDQRGLGQTRAPDRAYTMADYADDAAALLDALGWERCRVMGVSFGGMVAQELAIRHPERIERLVLACTSSGGAGGASYPLHELASLEPRARAVRGIEISDTRRDAGWRREHADQFEELVAFVLSQAEVGAGEPGRATGAARQLEARRCHDTYDRLAGLRMPVLVCAGSRDGIAPVANSLAIAERIPGARLEVFDGGHLFLVQDRSAYGRVVEFLGAS
jgi:3-oxoadipate enol-lactonase